MPETRRTRNKRPRHCNKNKLNISSWYKNCKLCGTLVVSPNSAGMLLHFHKFHPELKKSLVVPQPQVLSLNSQASTSSGNVGRKPQRNNVPRKPRKILRQPMRKLYHEIEEADEEKEARAMHFYIHPEKLPKGEMIRKRPARLHHQLINDDCTEVKSDTERAQDMLSGTPRTHRIVSQDTSLDDDGSKLAEAASVPLPCDAEDSNDDENKEVKVEELETQQVESAKRRKRPKRYSKLEDDFDTSGMPVELRDDPKMYKYWKKRHTLFHRFDEGIKLDRESWFSVTPENVARGIAKKCAYDVVLDAFCGAGGNTIQFAHTSKTVIAIDIDPEKISMARHNATVYGVADRIEFIVGDFFLLAPTLKADMVFLSPPWGGPKYTDNQEYDLETMLKPKPASELMRVARTISPNITFYLPRNSSSDEIRSLASDIGGSVEIKRSCLDSSFVAKTAYFY